MQHEDTKMKTVLLNDENLPEDLTPSSVFYACDGPKEQQIAELKRIKTLCDGVDSSAAADLYNEAVEALEELGE
jgi:hypothetical protein